MGASDMPRGERKDKGARGRVEAAAAKRAPEGGAHRHDDPRDVGAPLEEVGDADADADADGRGDDEGDRHHQLFEGVEVRLRERRAQAEALEKLFHICMGE